MITPRRRKRDTFLPWAQLFTDCVAINASLYLAFWLRFAGQFFTSFLGQADYTVYHKSFIIVTIIVVFFLRLYGLYRPTRVMTFADEALKVCKGAMASTIILMALTFFIRGFTFSRSFMILAGIILAIGISLGRYGLVWLIIVVDRRRQSFRNCLLIGCDEHARKIIKFYRKNPRFGVRIVGLLDNTLQTTEVVDRVPVMGRVSDLKHLLESNREIHEVILVAAGFSQDEVLRIIYECERQMVSFKWIADFFGLITAKMNVVHLAGVPMLSFGDSPLGDWENRILKRSMDILLSSLSLILLSPGFLLLCVLVKLDSKGAIFYKQERIGQDGRHFMLYKFRTMKVGAEEETGPIWARKDDPRRTRSGEFLRSHNLDELPQLWNVLKGDMSLVGPRPERPFFVSQFKEDIPRYMARHSIRSGITGWAQVNGLRGNTSIQERTKFDLFYVENWSLAFDLKILFMTLSSKTNAY